jgi:UDP-N-acetylglucosamine 3-dehydrogenase
MPTYTAAIIGLTGIASRRPVEPTDVPLAGVMPGSHAAAYHRHPQTTVVAVCDVRPAMIAQFQQTWHDVWPEVRGYTDYRALLADERLDLVSVCTPDHLHAEITVAAAASGARAILCEKPIATTRADADRMIAAADAHGVLLSIEHTRRWSPIYTRAQQLVRSGRYGTLRAIHCQMVGPRAMLFRNGTHVIDILCAFADSDPAWVIADLEPGFDHYTAYQSDGGHDPATDPAASAYVHFANGVRAFYHSMKTPFAGIQFDLFCDSARIEVTDSSIVVVQVGDHGQWSRTSVPHDHYMASYQLGAVDELIRVLEHGGDLVSSGREARKTVDIMLGILESHAGGHRRVQLGQ